METTKEEGVVVALPSVCVGVGCGYVCWGGGLLKFKDETHPRLWSRKNQVRLLKPATVNFALWI